MLKDVKYEFAQELYDIKEKTDNEQTKCLAIIGLTLLCEVKNYEPDKKPEFINIGNVKSLNQSQFSHGEQALVGEPSEHRKEEN